MTMTRKGRRPARSGSRPPYPTRPKREVMQTPHKLSPEGARISLTAQRRRRLMMLELFAAGQTTAEVARAVGITWMGAGDARSRMERRGALTRRGRLDIRGTPTVYGPGPAFEQYHASLSREVSDR